MEIKGTTIIATAALAIGIEISEVPAKLAIKEEIIPTTVSKLEDHQKKNPHPVEENYPLNWQNQSIYNIQGATNHPGNITKVGFASFLDNKLI